jgi:IS1 family transposase
MLDKGVGAPYACLMNRLPLETRARIIGLLVEGNSLRAVTRLVGCSINTVTKLLIDVGTAAAAHHDATVRNLRARRIQCDEIWSFVGAKAKNTTKEQRGGGMGDVWTWVALDADSKLCVSYLVGGRDGGWAFDFMCDVAARLRSRVQVTTDGHAAYLNAVEGAFGLDVDFATLHKIYGAVPEEDQRRYSPARCIGSDMKTVIGNPSPEHVSTSFVERQNLTMRMSMRRFTRLTNAFSKKLDNHAHAVALHFLHYNFARIHKSLRVTPAMEAGIADHVWTLEEIASLPDRIEARKVA